MPRDPLEDYAQGIDPTALPQQGSMLPIQTQGGLPFGAQPPQQPRAVPSPQFQAVPAAPGRAPLAQLGGQMPDVNQMIAERLQSLQGINPTKAKFSEAVRYYNALEELPKLTGIANIKSQDRQLQAQYLKESASQLEKFHAMPPEQQAALRPFMSGYLKNTSKLAGLDLGDEDVNHALTSPNLAGTYASITGDPLVTPQAQQAYLSRIGAAKPGKERDDAAQAVSKEIEQQALSMIQSTLPQVIAQMGGSAQKPLDMQAFLTSPQVKQVLDQSPILKRTFNAYVSNKANEDFLASVGLKPGSVVVKAMEGPALSAGVKDMLATIKGPDGKPLIPGIASVDQIKWAQDAHAKFEIAKAANQGLAVEQFKRTLPAPGEELSKYVDVTALATTGDLKKPIPGTTVADLYANKNLRFATPQQQERVQILAPTRQQLATFQTMADRLITATNPTEAAAQGVRLYAGAYTGSNPEAKAFLDSSLGFIGNLSRTLGGEKGVLTDLDREVMRKAAIASFFDTKASRDIKKAIINDIYKAAHTSAIGEIAGTSTQADARSNLDTLLKRLDTESKKSITASLRTDQMAIQNKETGEVRIGAKGSKVPQGWEVVR